MSNQTITSLHPQGNIRIMPLADLMGVHHTTIRRWVKAKKMPQPMSINGILLFRNADVLAFLDEQSKKQAEHGEV